jgi:hypothetical protein
MVALSGQFRAGVLPTFPCKLKRGTHRYPVYAVDASGNPQTNVAKGRLSVL